MLPHTASYSLAKRRSAPRWRLWLLLGLLASAGLTTRVLVESKTALEQGEAALARGERTAALRSFQHAVRLYVPASPFVARALANLQRLAEQAAQAQDSDTEQRALLALRAGLLGVRSLYTPFAQQLEWADDRLALLYAAREGTGTANPTARAARQAELATWHRDRLALRPGPDGAAIVRFLLGFGLWIGAATLFARRGIDRTLALRRNWAVGCAVAFVAGFSLFLSGVWL